VNDAEWERIKPLLPHAERKRKHSLREVVNAVFYQVRGGASWRMLPHDFPPWETVYGFFDRWKKAGVRERVHYTLREQNRVAEGREASPSAAIVDSQSVKTTEKGGSVATTPARRSRGESGTS
jgi:putative transposase